MAEITAVGTELEFPQAPQTAVAEPVVDERDEAMEDARKVFQITFASSVVFIVMALAVGFFNLLG